MPLAYATREELTVPDDAFNDDIATLLVHGGSYGGHWELVAQPVRDGTPGDWVGRIFTNPDKRPDMAVDTAVVWVNDACVKAGWKLAAWENKNHEYPPDQAPFFAAGIFVIDRRAAE